MKSGRFVQMFALGGALILVGEALPEALATYQPYKVPALTKTQNLEAEGFERILKQGRNGTCLLYTSPSPRDRTRSRMPSSA